MAGFMQKMDEALGKIKTDKVVGDLSSKKQMLQSAIQNEIAAIRNKISEEYLAIGEKAFRLYIEGEPDNESLTVHFNNITNYLASIAEKEAKSEDIAKRYDEEISLLKQFTTESPISQASVASPKTASDVCPQCKNPRKAEDLFCTHCGYKLTND